MGAVSATRTRVRNDIIRLVHRDLDLPELAGAVGRALVRVVPFEGTCLLTLDPATLLPTGEVVDNALPPAARARLTEIELGEPDFNKFTTLAHAALPAASLSAATDGELDRSLRQREVRRHNGFGDELRSVLTGPNGTWGTLTLLREATRPNFTSTDVRFVADLAPALADGVRRATLLASAAAGRHDGSDTGFLVVAGDDTIEVVNPPAERWIDELAGTTSSELPVAIRAVVAQTRQIAAGHGDALASARVHTNAGHWVMVRGSILHGGRVGVLLEAARPAELATAIADTYGFTERERTIVGLVAHGLTTAEIADRLYLSAYTVQDHLKAIFEKSGTGSRGELVARLFLEHHLPQLAATAGDL